MKDLGGSGAPKVKTFDDEGALLLLAEPNVNTPLEEFPPGAPLLLAGADPNVELLLNILVVEAGKPLDDCSGFFPKAEAKELDVVEFMFEPKGLVGFGVAKALFVTLLPNAFVVEELPKVLLVFVPNVDAVVTAGNWLLLALKVPNEFAPGVLPKGEDVLFELKALVLLFTAFPNGVEGFPKDGADKVLGDENDVPKLEVDTGFPNEAVLVLPNTVDVVVPNEGAGVLVLPKAFVAGVVLFEPKLGVLVVPNGDGLPLPNKGSLVVLKFEVDVEPKGELKPAVLVELKVEVLEVLKLGVFVVLKAAVLPKLGVFDAPKLGVFVAPKLGAFEPPKLGAFVVPKLGVLVEPKLGTLVLPKLGALVVPKLGVLVEPKLGALMVPKLGALVVPKLSAVVVPKLGALVVPKLRVLGVLKLGVLVVVPKLGVLVVPKLTGFTVAFVEPKLNVLEVLGLDVLLAPKPRVFVLPKLVVLVLTNVVEVPNEDVLGVLNNAVVEPGVVKEVALVVPNLKELVVPKGFSVEEVPNGGASWFLPEENMLPALPTDGAADPNARFKEEGTLVMVTPLCPVLNVKADVVSDVEGLLEDLSFVEPKVNGLEISVGALLETEFDPNIDELEVLFETDPNKLLVLFGVSN